MRGVLGHLFGLEAIVALLVLSLALVLTGFRRQAGAAFLLAITIAALPGIRSFLLQFFPLWVAIIISVMIILVALRFILGLLLGDAANHIVGQLTTDMIKGIFRFPLWLWRKLQLGVLMKRTGSAAGKSGMRAARQSHSYVKKRIAEKRETVSNPMQNQETCAGTITVIEGEDYYVELGDGITGILPVKSSRNRLEVGQIIDCKIIERIDVFMVEVRLSNEP